MRQRKITRELLEREYVQNGKSSWVIAKEVNCARSLVLRRIKEYGFKSSSPHRNTFKLDKEELRRLFVDEGKSQSEIARIAGCTESAVAYWVKRWSLRRATPRGDVNLLGERYGKWVVMSRDKGAVWRCRCDCGNERSVSKYDLLQGNTRGCKQCRWLNCSGVNSPRWKGCGEITGTRWGSIKNTASIMGRDFSISIEYAWNLFLKQGRKCAMTGVELTFSTAAESLLLYQKASLDRIDSSLGYVEGNVQWVMASINILKMNLAESRFVELCCLVADHKRKST